MSKLWTSGGAVFDRERPDVYRYLLWRNVAPLSGEGTLLFVMLNPSTADGREDDATVRRCCRFAVDLGYARVEVVNIYALRARDPKSILEASDPIGPGNDAQIAAAVKRARHVVAAWGDSDPSEGLRSEEVLRALVAAAPVFCLGRTMGGAPRHPLYLASSSTLDLYRPCIRAAGNLAAP